jgi:hypothetical protein
MQQTCTCIFSMGYMPRPMHQMRIMPHLMQVYMDKVLDSGDLAGAGITSDDTLVLLAVPDLPPAPAADNTPVR